MDDRQPSQSAPWEIPSKRRGLIWGLGTLAFGSFLLLVQNYGLTIFPDRTIEIPPSQIRPLAPEPSHAFVFPYYASEADEWLNPWSRVTFSENGTVYGSRTQSIEAVRDVGGEVWSHQPGRIVFASSDNTDPRTNGRRYVLTSPVLYRHGIAGGALIAFLGAVLGLYRLSGLRDERQCPLPRPPSQRWRRHLAGAGLLFIVGLYCNTGTLAPYAVASWAKVDPGTGYLYSNDHVHFRVLFDFVDGKSRAVWDHALLLRRILFPVLGWPLMKLWGFEIGGTVASLLLNLAGWGATVVLLRRQIGEKGAIFAAWILALYPGAAYWGGLPYPYALIFPASLLLMCGLLYLPEAKGMGLAVVSLAMGLAYVGYDLVVFYVPATLLLLIWHRRRRDALLAAVLQLTPLALWVLLLRFAFGQPLDNSNTMVYGLPLAAYLHPGSLGEWWPVLREASAVGLEVFFGANFIFLPALFIAVLALNPLTARIRFWPAELALLVSGLGLFLFLNLAPPYHAGWMMRGSWIARLYQPVFPALVLFAARWWQNLPPMRWPWRLLIFGLVAGVMLGNALIVFGPILDDPGKVSEAAFFRFYADTEDHGTYEHNLTIYGRRPLGFIKPQPPEPTEGQIRAGMRNLIITINQAIIANQHVLAQNRSAYATEVRALAAIRAELRSSRSQAQPAEEGVAATPNQDRLEAPLGPGRGQRVATTPEGLQDALAAANARLAAVERSVLQAQGELARVRTETAEAEAQLSRARRERTGEAPAN